MPWPKGQERGSKTGGRAPGTPNVRTQVLTQRFDELGLDPVAEIHRLLPKLQPEKRVDVLLDLLPFLYPRRKSIEVTPTMEPITARFSGMSDEQKREELKSTVLRMARRMECKLVPLDDSEQ